MVSSSALSLAASNGIPVLILQRSGQLGARVLPADVVGHAALRRAQAAFPDHPWATEWCLELLKSKTMGQDRVLGILATWRGGQRERIEEARTVLGRQLEAMATLQSKPLIDVRSSILGHEGTAARAYWQVIGSILPDELSFQERSRRPALDTFNSCLNYTYAILLGQVDVACLACGMDTDLGVLHTDSHGRPSYSLDILEAVRPWADELLVKLTMEGQLRKTWCKAEDGGMLLTSEARRKLIPSFNEFFLEHCQFGANKSSRRNHLMRLARKQTETIRQSRNLQNGNQ